MFNLTRSQARQRAQTILVSHIDVTVDLTRAGDLDETHYPVTSVFTMTLNRPSTFVDVVGTVDEVLVDDAPHAFHHDGSRLDLDDLPTSRPITLTVRAHCSFSRTGEGLHRYLDPKITASTCTHSLSPPMRAEPGRVWISPISSRAGPSTSSRRKNGLSRPTASTHRRMPAPSFGTTFPPHHLCPPTSPQLLQASGP